MEIKADGENEPASFWEAEVLVIKEDFIKVRFMGGGESIVGAKKIRPSKKGD